MSLLSFTPNTRVLLLEREFLVVSVSRTDKGTELQLTDEDGVECTKSLGYLLHQYAMGNLKAPKHNRPGQYVSPTAPLLGLAADLPPRAFDEGLRKWHLLTAIRNAGGFEPGNKYFWTQEFPQLCMEYGFPSTFDRSTVNRWLKVLTLAPGVAPEVLLAPMHRLKGGAGRSRMDPVVDAIVERCVEDIFLSNPGASIRHCHLELVARVHAENRFRDPSTALACPSYQQLRRRISSMSAFEILASREGKETADLRFRSTRYVRRNLTRALQRVEVDHTPIDVFIVNSDGVLLGRARLTLVVCVSTRAIVGFSIGYDGTSVISVLEALQHSVTPKTYLRERYPGIQNDWPMCGVFEVLAMDNGSEFHGEGFKQTLRELCISNDLAYMPRRKAYFKGTVEALQKFLNRDMSDLQHGATQSHHWQRNKERPPEEYAVHTLASLIELVHIWVCDIYHVRIHRDLKSSPLLKWRDLTQMMPVRLPPSVEALELVCTELIARKLQPYGVEVCGVRAFNCERLQQINRKYRHKDTVWVSVRYKPKLLDKIWVKDVDTAEWFEIQNGDPQTRDKSQYQLQYIDKLIRQAATDEKLTISIATAYASMRAVGQALYEAKTIAQRRRALKILGIIPSVDGVVAAITFKPTTVTPDISKPKATQRRPTKPKQLTPFPSVDLSAEVTISEPEVDPAPRIPPTPFRTIAAAQRGT